MARALRIPLLLTALALCAAPRIRAADITLPEPEAPTTIFSTQIGGADVSLDLAGSWQARVSGTLGLLIVPGLPQPVQALDTLPPLDEGLFFSQTPDLTVSLFLFKKLFLDVSVLSDSTKNSIALGYRGDSTEFLRHVLIGNRGVSMEPTGFLEVPDQSETSLGASVLLGAGAATNEFLLRWDSSEEKTKVFLGPNELVQQTVPLDSYIRGRYFFLPDTGVQSFAVYLEDPVGTLTGSDGKKYRVATLEDASIDSASGLVSLKARSPGRVLAYYTKNGKPVGDATLGVNALPDGTGAFRNLAASQQFSFSPTLYLGKRMDSRQVTVDGKTSLLLWQPGDTSPFEIDSSYAFTSTPPADPSRVQIEFTAKAPGAPLPQGSSFVVLPDENRFVVVKDPVFRADFHNMYPFADDDPKGLLYGPPSDSRAGYFTYEMTASFLSPVQGYFLDPSLVPGSVRVTVNGIPETRFQADITTGRVSFLRDLLPSDRVEISYRTSSTTVSGGDILFAWKDTIPFSDALNLTIAAGIRWNADPWTYSQKAYAKSGTILASAGIEGKGEGWSYSVTGGVAFTDPDTSGVLRLFGMEGNSLAVDLAEDTWYPASTPNAGEIAVVPAVSDANRGALFYKDYRSYDALGNATLQTIASPNFTATPYADGGRMGPYNVTGGSQGASTGQSLVYDFQIPASGGWVGSQATIVSGADADLSTARAVTMRYQALDLSGTISAYLQLGAVSESIDGGTAILAEASATDGGFRVTVPAGPILRVGGGPRGQGNGKLDTEDRNSNKILDVEDPSSVVTIPVALNTDGSWHVFQYTLSDSERARLRSARQARLIVYSAAASQGNLLVDSLAVEGAAVFATASAGSFSVKEISEPLAISDPGLGNRLTDRHPEVNTMFHPKGETQEVLEVSWGSPTPVTAPLTVTGYSGADSGGIAYDTVAFFLRLVPALTNPLSFSLVDPQGKGIHWVLGSPSWAALSDSAWHEVRVSRTGGVSVDGAALAGAAAPTFDRGFGSLLHFEIQSDDTSGLLYIDEVRLLDPQGALGASLVAEASYERQGTLLSLGDAPLLGNLAVHQRLSLISPGFATLYGIPSPVEDLFSETELAADVAFTRLQADLLLREYGGSFTASGSHRVTVPAQAFPVSVMDAFSLTWTGDFTREDSLVVSPPGGASLSLDTQASAARTDVAGQDTALLNQSWDGKLSLGILPPVTLTSELSLFQASDGYTLPPTWYGDRWIREMSLVLPWTGGLDRERRGSLDVDVGLPAAPLGIEAKTRAFVRSTDFTGFGRNQQNDLDSGLTLSWRLGSGGADSLSVSLAYDRQISLMTSPGRGERFLSEAGTYADLLALQGYLLTSVPFLEIFQDNTAAVQNAWSQVTRGLYSPSATLSMQRGYSSRLQDLLLPTGIDLTVGQRLEKDGDLTSTLVTISPKVSSHALNLFGQLGAYPVLPFARTDEYSVSAGVSLTGSPDGPYEWTDALVEVSATVDGLSDEHLTFLQSFKRQETDPLTVTLTDSTQVAYLWTFKPPGGIPIPLIPAELGATAYLEHKESAEASIRYASPGAYHPVTVLVGHDTSLVFPSHGFLKASAQIAFDLENLLGGSFAYRIGFEAGLEAKLSF